MPRSRRGLCLADRPKKLGLGELGSPSVIDSAEDIGLFGYQIIRIERENKYQVRVFFKGPQSTSPVVISVPAGPLELRPFPFTGISEFHPTRRFHGSFDVFLAGTCAWMGYFVHSSRVAVDSFIFYINPCQNLWSNLRI